MKLKATAAVLSAAALFAACSDEVVNVNDEAKEKATFTFKVVDDYTGNAIAEASVYSVMDDESETTDSLGIVSWSKNAIGNYVYYVSAEGYKTIQVGASADEVGQGNVARVPDVFKEVRMVKGGVEATGTILYNDAETGATKPASKVKVFANCGSKFVPSEMSATTDANGKFTFDDLPAGTSCAITVGQTEIGSKLYSGANIGATTAHRSGEVENLSIATLSPVRTSLVKISDNLKEISSVSTALTFVFSAEVDADSIPGKWIVRQNGDKILVSVSLSKDKKTVTVKPFSGKWDEDASYTISADVYSVDGAYEDVYASFAVGAKGASGAPANVKNLAAEDDDGYILLSWKGETDRYYNVYWKTSKMNAFERLDYCYGSSYSYDDWYCEEESYEFNPPIAIDVEFIEFVVLPVNDDGVEADINGAKSVKYVIE